MAYIRPAGTATDIGQKTAPLPAGVAQKWKLPGYGEERADEGRTYAGRHYVRRRDAARAHARSKMMAWQRASVDCENRAIEKVRKRLERERDAVVFDDDIGVKWIEVIKITSAGRERYELGR